MAVDVKNAPTFTIGERRLVLAGDYLTNPSHPNYDVAPDGSSLLVLRHAGEDVQTILVYNWVEELRARTSSPR